MKKTILTISLFSSILVLSLASCEKIKDTFFPGFDTQLNEVSVNIPIVVQSAEATTSNTMSFNLDSTIKANTANTFGVDNLSSIKVKSVGIFINNNDNLNDVSNFESVSLQFSSNTNTTPTVVASASIPDQPASSLNIKLANSPELKEYLKGNELHYTVTGTARRSTTKVLNATVSVTLSVK